MANYPVLTLDAEGSVCDFESRYCTSWMLGHGGFDRHHKWPKSMGGSAHVPLLTLCPNHHRRQHALLRYLVECDAAKVLPAWSTVRRFKAVERDSAEYAVEQWIAAGRPQIDGWATPAARD